MPGCLPDEERAALPSFIAENGQINARLRVAALEPAKRTESVPFGSQENQLFAGAEQKSPNASISIATAGIVPFVEGKRCRIAVAGETPA
jgi:hypothetical protein